MPRRHPAMAGFTLAETLLVTAILAVAAGVALPSSAPVAEARLDAAASEVAAALRFARDEAIRTSDYRVVSCDTSTNRLRVYRQFDIAGYTVDVTLQHPLTRQAYNIELGSVPAGGNVDLAACSFAFADGSATQFSFDPKGLPVRGTGDATKLDQSLAAGSVVVAAGALRRTVTVEVTGRVTAS